MINKKILVLGASGFIGTNFIKINQKKFKKITGVYFKNKIFKKFKNVKYIKANLKNSLTCKKVCKNVDIIYIFAANTSGSKVIMNDPLTHFHDNLLINLNVLKAAYENKIKKIIFISSNTVYPVSKKKMSERHMNYEVFDKYFIVGWMKIFSEIASKIYSQKLKKKISVLVIRPGNLYGPHDKFDDKRSKVIPAIIKKVSNSLDEIEVWGDGKDLKDFLYIDDFINILTKLSLKFKGFEVINVARGKSIILMSVIKRIIKIIQGNKKIKIKLNKDKPKMIPVRKLSISKLNKRIQNLKFTGLNDGLKRTIKWYLKENKNLKIGKN